MDSALKQRLIGAGVLILLAVIFLPMLIKGPAPDGSKDMEGVPASVPAVPDAQVDSRDMDFATGEPVSVAAPQAAAPTTYSVHFGNYATEGDARTVVDAFKAKGLTASFRPNVVEGRTLQQILIGPFSTRDEAETARQAALQLSAIDGSRIIENRAAPVTAAAPVAATATAPAATAPAASASPSTVATEKPAAAPVAEVKAPAAPKPEEPKPAAPPADSGRYTVVLGSSPYPARSEALHKRAAAAGIDTVLFKTKNDKGQPIVVVRTKAVSKDQAESVKAEVALKLQRTSQVQKL